MEPDSNKPNLDTMWQKTTYTKQEDYDKEVARVEAKYGKQGTVSDDGTQTTFDVQKQKSSLWHAIKAFAYDLFSFGTLKGQIVKHTLLSRDDVTHRQYIIILKPEGQSSLKTENQGRPQQPLPTDKGKGELNPTGPQLTHATAQTNNVTRHVFYPTPGVVLPAGQAALAAGLNATETDKPKKAVGIKGPEQLQTETKPLTPEEQYHVHFRQEMSDNYENMIDNAGVHLNAYKNTKLYQERSNSLIAKAAENPELQEKLVEQAKSFSITIPEKLLPIINDYITRKQQDRNTVIKGIFEGMTPDEFVQRLLKNRPLVYYNTTDITILRNEGDNKDDPSLYNDIEAQEIASYLSISSDVQNINNGNRVNRGVPDPSNQFEETGRYSSVIGARLEKTETLAYRHAVMEKGKEAVEDPLWAEFYGIEQFPAYDDIKFKKIYAKDLEAFLAGKVVEGIVDGQEDKKEKLIEVGEIHGQKIMKVPRTNKALNLTVIQSRTETNFRGALLEEDRVAGERGLQAMVHVVCPGGGAWSKIPGDNKSQTDNDSPDVGQEIHLVVEKAMSNVLATTHLPNVSKINYAWWRNGKGKDPEFIKAAELSGSEVNPNLKIEFSKRNPADVLTGEDEGKQLSMMYAWDPNAFAGNDYLDGAHAFAISGDPAAAVSSNLAEIQNPLVNPFAQNAQPMYTPTSNEGLAENMQKQGEKRTRRVQEIEAKLKTQYTETA